jgi:hypothetical protein
MGSINRRIVVQAGPSIKQDSIPKITKTKKAGDMADVVDHLPSKNKALSTTPVLPKTEVS